MTVSSSIRLRRPPAEDLPAPEGANFFSFAYVNSDVVMQVGYVDPLDVHNASGASPDGEPEGGEGGGQVYLNVTHRFHLSPSGLEFLKDQVNEIWGKLEKLQETRRRQQESKDDD